MLVPGVGAQGGNLENMAKYGMNQDCGLLVNSSRGIIYSGDGVNFAENSRKLAATNTTQNGYSSIRKRNLEFDFINYISYKFFLLRSPILQKIWS